MFLDDQLNLFSSTLKQNIIYQAASMLLQHVTIKKHFHHHHRTQNTNGNALDEHRYFRRMNKCNSWLAKSETSINRYAIPMRFHSNNANSNEEFSQPLMVIRIYIKQNDMFYSS